jgi:hypothetical protein
LTQAPWQLGVKVSKTMAMLKKEFPLACFHVISHLVLHLVEEFDLCGPIHTRWMYPMERYMIALKDFVRNDGRPEGNMAIGYAI